MANCCWQWRDRLWGPGCSNSSLHMPLASTSETVTTNPQPVLEQQSGGEERQQPRRLFVMLMPSIQKVFKKPMLPPPPPLQPPLMPLQGYLHQRLVCQSMNDLAFNIKHAAQLEKIFMSPVLPSTEVLIIYRDTNRLCRVVNP